MSLKLQRQFQNQSSLEYTEYIQYIYMYFTLAFRKFSLVFFVQGVIL